jgi:hypothetical protein
MSEDKVMMIASPGWLLMLHEGALCVEVTTDREILYDAYAVGHITGLGQIESIAASYAKLGFHVMLRIAGAEFVAPQRTETPCPS